MGNIGYRDKGTGHRKQPTPPKHKILRLRFPTLEKTRGSPPPLRIGKLGYRLQVTGNRENAAA